MVSFHRGVILNYVAFGGIGDTVLQWSHSYLSGLLLGGGSGKTLFITMALVLTALL